MSPDDENEIFKVVFIGVGVLALIGGGSFGFRADIANWLHHSHVLVEHATLPVPGLGGGIGLDVARLIVVAGLLTTGGALTWIVVRSRRAKH